MKRRIFLVRVFDCFFLVFCSFACFCFGLHVTYPALKNVFLTLTLTFLFFIQRDKVNLMCVTLNGGYLICSVSFNICSHSKAEEFKFSV